jgi:hypothetical protein
MSQALTPGQLKIREIIHEFLPRYKQLSNGNGLGLLFCEIRERFSKDSVINSDPCVCQSLAKPEEMIARPYLRWLYAMSSSSDNLTIIENGEYSVNLDNFIYSPSIRSGQSEAYRGGDKIHTTYKVLFLFAENKSENILRGDDWSTLYYEKDGILEVSGGGRHRLLACVLWGNNLINPERLYIIKNLSDTDLHNAIITIQLCMQRTDLEFTIYHRLKESGDDNKKNLINEAFDIKNFVKMVKPKELEIIVDFLCYDTRIHLYGYLKSKIRGIHACAGHTVVIYHFIQVLHEYREIQSRTWVQRIIANITRKSNVSKGKITLFENWIFENHEVY